MHKLKKMFILLTSVLFLGNTVMASGVGSINYQKVQDNYPYAQKVIKEVEAKALALQQYITDKEKEFKSIDTPLKKKAFEDKITVEFKDKENAFINYKLKKEEEIYKKIQEAAKAVMVEQNLDAVIDYRVMFIGGVDISDLVIEKLKGGKQ
ncbi:OmpH family outer membrane protein [bacterium]|nr:OmpH family outer membrane protein [bacterium]